MESHDIDLEARQAQGPFVEERETENLSDGVLAVEQRERHPQQSTDTNVCATAGNVSSGEEDETQLAAIRELMQRAFARGVWLTLGEIADATEFAEASISAQLRHLRKPHHGGHRVEKRRRSPLGAAEVASAGDMRRGPVIWEYRVLPAMHALDIVRERRVRRWRKEKAATHSDCTSGGERDA